MPQKRSILVCCENCDLEFSAVPYEVKRGYGKFCSRQCQRSFQAKLNAGAMKGDLTHDEMRARWHRSVDPKVHKAHDAVETAIANGTLQRQPCEVCGATRVDAHHDDYDRPLHVRWLCRGHHLMHHRSKA